MTIGNPTSQRRGTGSGGTRPDVWGQGSNAWGREQVSEEPSDTWGAPSDDTFGGDPSDFGGGRNKLDFGSSSFDSANAGSDTFGDTSSDTFGDVGGDTFGMDGGFGGGYDAYGFSDTVDTSKCGCFPKKEERLDMDLLARHLYDLLRREAFVERERLGNW